MTTCAGCEHLIHINRGTIPRTLCRRYRKPAIVKCLDYRRAPKPVQPGKTAFWDSLERAMYFVLSGRAP